MLKYPGFLTCIDNSSSRDLTKLAFFLARWILWKKAMGLVGHFLTGLDRQCCLNEQKWIYWTYNDKNWHFRHYSFVSDEKCIREDFFIDFFDFQKNTCYLNGWPISSYSLVNRTRKMSCWYIMRENSIFKPHKSI